jgi:hypothetical protein
MSSMGFTEEEQTGADTIFEYLCTNQTTNDMHDKTLSAYKAFSTLLQYPSLLSRFRKIRNIVQSKIDEFIVKPTLSPNLVDVLQRVQIILDGISHRSDYIE